MITRFLPTVLALCPIFALAANVAPTPVIVSATMRPGTTLMDVVFRVDDPDDATVKTRALAFVDGDRSFAKVIRPVTFVEGTAAKIGNAIATNTNHTLTWDVAVDWHTDLGQLKFEILAMDGRGLLPFDWITIPAAAGKPALTISKDAPTDAAVLDALFWQYADGDTGLLIENGVLRGNDASGVFAGVRLVDGSTVQAYATPFVFKRTNLAVANETPSDMSYAIETARADVLNPADWHAYNKPYDGVSIVVSWGNGSYGQNAIPKGLAGVIAITSNSIALKNDRTVFSWGEIKSPIGLNDVTAISSCGNGYGRYWDERCFALKGSKTVVGWEGNGHLTSDIPASLSNVTEIASRYYCIALKSDGTVVTWGSSNLSASLPSNLSGVVKIAASSSQSYALKNDGTVVYWDYWGSSGSIAGLTGVTSIAAGYNHALALKNDGTVVSWGNSNSSGQQNTPSGLTGVISIAAGSSTSFALKNDGTVVGWGSNSTGVLSIPSGLTGVSSIAVDEAASEGSCVVYALKSKAL